MPLPAKALLRPDEVASYYRVTVRTVYNWIKRGSITTVLVNGKLRVPREAILEALETRGQG